VVILGILAAIVIPQFTNASQDAQRGNIVTQLQSIRNQIELFRVKNNGSLPDMAFGGKDFGDLLAGTNNTQGLAATNSFGATQEPYMRTPPANPRNGLSTLQVINGAGNDPSVVASAAAATPTTAGWVYNSTTGAIAAFGFNETTNKWFGEP